MQLKKALDLVFSKIIIFRSSFLQITSFVYWKQWRVESSAIPSFAGGFSASTTGGHKTSQEDLVSFQSKKTRQLFGWLWDLDLIDTEI